MNWTSRKQWSARVGTPDTARVLITITREMVPPGAALAPFSWWLDPVDSDARPVYCTTPAISLTEAKRRSVADAEAMVARLVAARGGC